jgi:hypothetical protein
VADQDLDHNVYVARPRRVRMIAIISSIALCVIAALGWLLLPAEIRVLFPLTHRLALFVILAFPIAVKQLRTRRPVRPSDSQRSTNTLGALGSRPQDHPAAGRSMGSTVAQTR